MNAKVFFRGSNAGGASTGHEPWRRRGMSSLLERAVRCDVKAAFLRRPSTYALIKAASHMNRYIDPRAPTDISDLKLNELKTVPGIVKYRQLRDNLSRDVRAEFGTVKKSEGTKIYEMYQNAEANLLRQKVKLRRSAFKESRGKFFETIETRDINERLDLSLLELDPEGLEPEIVERELMERKHISGLMCNEPSHLNEEASLQRRIGTIEGSGCLLSRS